MDELLEVIQHVDPLWSVVLVAIALAILVIAKLWSASFAKVLGGLAVLAVVGAAGAAGYFGYAYLEETRRLEERRLLEERIAGLFNRAVEPDSVFACLDGSPVPAMQEGCERTLFAEPQRVAAAVAIVTQRLALLADALEFANTRDAGYLDRIEPLRKSVETDPYGFVAFVLSVEHQCTPDTCRRFELLRDPATVKENMRVRRLEAYMAKHSVAWRGSSLEPAISAPETSKPTTAPLVTISEPARPSATGESSPAQSEASPATTEAKGADKPADAAGAVPQAPVAASAPVVVPPSDASGFGGSSQPPSAAGAAQPAEQQAAPSGTKPAPTPPLRPVAQPKAAPQTRAKAKADPVTRRTTEPVAGLPRVVPSDYIRNREEEEHEAAAQASGQPGTPTPITPPQQNFR